MIRKFFKENKILVIFILALLLSQAVWWMFYLFSHQLVQAMYEERAIEALNRIIRGRDINPLDYYFKRLKTALFIIDIFFLFCLFFLFLSLGKKEKGILSKLYKLFTTRIFNPKDILALGASFFLIIAFSNIITTIIIRGKFLQKIQEEYLSTYWPISVFDLRLPHWEHLLLAITVFILFYLFVKILPRIKSRLWYLILIGIVLVFGTNLIQGIYYGFVNPIAGINQYYPVVIKISDVSSFLRHFQSFQPFLYSQHSHISTHPPGASLAIYTLWKIVEQPSFISIVIAILSVSLSVFFFHKLISTEVSLSTSNYATTLYILIPSIQIYYLATVDALIASFLLGVLYFFRRPNLYISIIGSIIFLFLSSFLTFAFLFILPVLVGFEIIDKRSIKKSFFILSGLVLIYIMIYILFGFNYINSFIIASRLENPNGFKLIADPVTYLFTRIENIFEIFLFLGPFLIALMVRGIPIMKRNNPHLYILTLLGGTTLLAMFATGAFRTGETARICQFIYPYIMLPIAVYLENLKIINFKERFQLAGLVFIQTILMQLFGNYFW